MPSATLLLPATARLRGRIPDALAWTLGRADRLPLASTGERAQLRRQFGIVPDGLPIAALTRQMDIGDAGTSAWLRADPAWIRADINGARLFACSEGMRLTQADVDALRPALASTLADAGFEFDAPSPGRWYVRMPEGSQAPELVDPADALGVDLFDLMQTPAGDDGALVRRWRALDSDIQVMLHNHPHNARRIAAGQPPVNALWFWGSGVRPTRVTTGSAAVWSNDASLQALAAAAGVPTATLPSGWIPPDADVLIDLRDVRNADDLATIWLLPAIDGLNGRALESIRLDLADGSGFAVRAIQRLRFWRRPLQALQSSAPLVEEEGGT